MSKIPTILEDLYLKNLNFFKKQNPSIHHVLSNTKPDHSKIIIDDQGGVDLNYNGKNIYNGDAIKYVEAETAEFNDIYKDRKRATNMPPATPGLYSAPRFFHKHLNQTIIDMYTEAGEVSSNRRFHNDQHDSLIVMGIGLGLHISELIDTSNIQNLLILETDHELLALSCFFTDWESVYEKQSPKNKKSITLLLMDKQELESEQGLLWNQLVKRAPHFPFNTVFYNHGRHDKYGEIIRKVSSDVKMFTSLWGFYDDESNQLNNILHNLNNKIKLIPKKSEFKWAKPVIVCGSGPSLDSRMEQLKSIREKCVLISAGTSLLPLLTNGLTPDFHVEIESDFNTYEVLKGLNIDDKLKELTLICAIQCSPYITTLFKETYSFVKDSLSTGDIYENFPDKLIDPTPTCVNSALSFALQFNAKKVFLFGTDFGFYNTEEHHSKHSIYNEAETETEIINEARKNNQKRIDISFEEKGYNGPCLTTVTYFTTKRRVETLISAAKLINSFEIFNCSDGLIIPNTEHMQQDVNLTLVKSKITDNLENFKSKSRETSHITAQKIGENLNSSITSICTLLINNLKVMDTNIESLSATCWAFSNYINSTHIQKFGNLVYFIRGSIWHYMYAGYSIAYACEYEKQPDVIEIWRLRFIDLLEKLPADLNDNIDKKRDDFKNDPQLRTAITDKIET